MNELSFRDGAWGFIEDLANLVGHDLIYSLALEKGNLFVCVTAHPSMTQKEFDTGNVRILFIIDESEYDLPQGEVVKNLAKQIQDHII